MKKLILFFLFSAPLCAQVQVAGSAVQIGGVPVGTTSTEGAAPVQVNGDSGTQHTGDVVVSCPSCNTGIIDFQPTLNPPIGGQYYSLYPSACTAGGSGPGGASCAANSYSSSGSLSCTSASLNPCSQTITYTFALPTGITQGQITAVYAQLTSSWSGFAGTYAQGACTDGDDMRVAFNTGLQTFQTSAFSPVPTVSTMNCVFNLQSSGGNPVGSTLQLSGLFLYVYYTGTTVPSPVGTTIYPPLVVTNGGLGLSLPLAPAVDSTNTNSYNVTVPAYEFPNQLGIDDDIWLQVAHANTSATPTIAINGSNPITVVKAGGALVAGDMAETPIVNHLVYNGADWQLLNPATGFSTLSATLTTTAATTDDVAIVGMTSSGHCGLAATNAAAATNIATTYVSAKTTDQVTVTHTATASMTYDLVCTKN